MSYIGTAAAAAIVTSMAVLLLVAAATSGGGVDDALEAASSTMGSLNALNTFLAGGEGGGGGGGGGGTERCEFRCPGGQQPQPKPGYRPTFNGCGSKEFRIDTSHMPDITNCCNRHDICYGTCNVAKSACEEQFRTCLTSACDTMRASGKLHNQKAFNTCRSLGATFHETVVNFGCDFYLDAQAEACQCEEVKSRRDIKATGHQGKS